MQVGLILCLLFTYVLFEMKFEGKNYELAKVDYEDRYVEYVPENFTVEKFIIKERHEDRIKKVNLTK